MCVTHVIAYATLISRELSCVPITMPGHRKLLPRPCPLCERENGGIQWELINPKSYLARTGYPRRIPYLMLRISHYVPKNERKTLFSKKNYTKRTHSFRLKRIQAPNDIFDQPPYRRKQTLTFPFTAKNYEEFKDKGWPEFETKRAHWLSKGRFKVCKQCHKVSKNLIKAGRGRYAPWLCTPCYSKFDFSF